MKKTAKDTKKKAAAKPKDLKLKKDVKGGVSGTKLSDKDGNTGSGLIVR